MHVQKESRVAVRPVKKPATIMKFLPRDQEKEITIILANMIMEERSNYEPA
jgi:hypothetical protein